MDQDQPSPEKRNEKGATDRQKLVAALLFGLDHLESEKGESLEQSTSTEPTRIPLPPTQQVSQSGDSTERKTSGSISSILSFIDRQIPPDAAELRETPLYQSAQSALRFQRDQYLVGPDYASWRRRHLRRIHRRVPLLPYEASAFGHQQFRPLIAQFITTETVVRALTPLIAYELPKAAFPIMTAAAVSIVESQQSNLNQTVQQSLLEILCNPENRQAMKSSIANYNDDGDTTTTSTAATTATATDGNKPGTD